MRLPWAVARVLPFRLWRLYWRVRMAWRARQLTRLQRQCAAIHRQCDANIAQLRAVQRRLP